MSSANPVLAALRWHALHAKVDPDDDSPIPRLQAGIRFLDANPTMAALACHGDQRRMVMSAVCEIELPFLVKIGSRLTGNDHDGLDLAQKVVTKIEEADWGRLALPDLNRPYLIKSVRNERINDIRRLERQRRGWTVLREQAESEEETWPGKEMEWEDIMDALKRRLIREPKVWRAFCLVCRQHLSREEAASTMETTVRTIYIWLNRAYEAFAEILRSGC